jgi:hypothetical protein
MTTTGGSKNGMILGWVVRTILAAVALGALAGCPSRPGGGGTFNNDPAPQQHQQQQADAQHKNG